MFIVKFAKGKYAVSENGTTSILVPPRGVTYDIKGKRWSAQIWEDDKWGKVTFPISNGIVFSYYQAIKARKDNLGVLLNRRLLKHQIRQVLPSCQKGVYSVNNPAEKNVLRTRSLKQAEGFQSYAAERWIDLHEYDLKKEMANVKTTARV